MPDRITGKGAWQRVPRRWLLAMLFGAAGSVQGADAPWELIYNPPVETTLTANDLRRADQAWSQMFDQAQQQIDIAAFYVSGKAGSRLNQVIDHLRQAGERGVKIRVLMEQKGESMSTPETLAALKAIPNLTFREIGWGPLTGGIQHAKYLLVDNKVAYIGSQNFDWRSLEHIHETGLLIHEPEVVRQAQAIFDHDWQLQARIAAGEKVSADNLPSPALASTPDIQLVASPQAWNPAGVVDSEQALTTLMGNARQQVNIMVMDYTPLAYGRGPVRQYYPVIDNAVKTAAAHGAQVNLMVADWNLHYPALSYLKSLTLLPHITVKYVHIPTASSGVIPFARVMHTKAMTLDGKQSWIGTSNWSGGYLDNSRNLEVVVNDVPLTQRLDTLFMQLWQSEYAHPLTLQTEPAKKAPQS